MVYYRVIYSSGLQGSFFIYILKTKNSKPSHARIGHSSIDVSERTVVVYLVMTALTYAKMKYSIYTGVVEKINRFLVVTSALPNRMQYQYMVH